MVQLFVAGFVVGPGVSSFVLCGGLASGCLFVRSVAVVVCSSCACL